MLTATGLIHGSRQSLPLEETGVRQPVGQEKTKLEDLSRQFEAIFVYKMLQTMRKTVPATGFLEIPGRATYEMLMDQQIAEDIARRGNGMGLGRMIYEQLSQRS